MIGVSLGSVFVTVCSAALCLHTANAVNWKLLQLKPLNRLTSNKLGACSCVHTAKTAVLDQHTAMLSTRVVP